LEFNSFRLQASRTFSTHREKGKFFDDAMRNPG
jgi:hypothetical protein